MQNLIDWYIVYICFILCSTNYKLAGKCWISQDISIIVMIDQAHSYLTLYTWGLVARSDNIKLTFVSIRKSVQ
ncbi:hypothetical protein BDP27DRAFT_1323716 [Rhodocollybia butyracea]|uniref:Uncharacterized protein n=1 Tax=Rhodocollybia butyracea TaxID=206335 RepID=A0A9P5PXU9_9AGAR|nr:hypothetical protein BDP27DRAFT_1323716 [Rhodocollybia butyracea]